MSGTERRRDAPRRLRLLGVDLGRIAAWCWFGMTLAAALRAHALMALGSRAPNVFDEPLRLLQSVYTARGLVPYVDFGFLYPPGLAWLYGDLLGLTVPTAVFAAQAALDLALVFCATALVMGSAGRRPLIVGGLVLLLQGALLPPMFVSTSQEPLATNLVPLIVILVWKCVVQGLTVGRLTGLAGLAAVTTLIRWDRLLGLGLLALVLAGSLELLIRVAPSDPEQRRQAGLGARRLAIAALANLSGVAGGLAAFVAPAIVTGRWQDLRTFVFDLPLVTLPYHSLPLPAPQGEFMQWVVDLGAILFIVVASFVADRGAARPRPLVGLVEATTLLVGPIALLPYSLTRADPFHFLALTALLLATGCIALLAWTGRSSRWPVITALCLVSMPLLPRMIVGMITERPLPVVGRYDAATHALTDGCTRLLPARTRSLFVGQVSYDRYLSSFAMFYLMHPEIRPATRFISDEPGVQNSCRYGAMVAADLDRAPRPLVAVLDRDPWPAEPNLTATMKSCGKIEAVFARPSARVLGTCRMGERDFEMMELD